MTGYLRNLFVLIMATATLILSFDSGAASRIYKTVDANGNVVFTDIPPKDGEAGEAMTIENPNTFQPAAPESREQWIVDSADENTEGAEAAAFTYQSLTISAPTSDEAIRENAGNVNVVANVVPELQTGHRVRILMDGKPEQAAARAVFMLPNVDRGSHSVQAEVIDDTGKVLITSSSTTFHLQRVAAAPRARPSN
jgi:hypothetical protein